LIEKSSHDARAANWQRTLVIMVFVQLGMNAAALFRSGLHAKRGSSWLTRLWPLSV
jgi:hypothetical protein